MTAATFDTVADLYDRMVDWEKRLPREVGHLDRLLRREGARTVLDAACGTGAHLAALRELGYDVAGSDISPEMVKSARERLPGVPVLEADFTRAGEGIPPRDAVLVIGNSLPNAGSEEGVRDALAGLARAVRPGGVLVVHTLSYPLLVREGGGLRPLRRVVEKGREYLFLKLFEVHPEKVVLDVIVLVREEEEIAVRLLRSDLFPLTSPWLEAALAGLGLRVTDRTNGFSEEPYDEDASGDLLVVATKEGARP